MKCDIIKDLLPSYIDDLTSEESNTEIEKHLSSCDECTEYYEQMKSDISVAQTDVDVHKINIFKKINRRIMRMVALTVTAIILLIGGYLYFFAFGWQADFEDVTITPVLEDDSITLEFELTNGRVLNVFFDKRRRDSDLAFRECFHSILDDRGVYPNRFSYGFNIKDDDGNIIEYGDNEYLVLKFKDKVEVLYYKDLIKEL